MDAQGTDRVEMVIYLFPTLLVFSKPLFSTSVPPTPSRVLFSVWPLQHPKQTPPVPQPPQVLLITNIEKGALSWTLSLVAAMQTLQCASHFTSETQYQNQLESNVHNLRLFTCFQILFYLGFFGEQQGTSILSARRYILVKSKPLFTPLIPHNTHAL